MNHLVAINLLPKNGIKKGSGCSAVDIADAPDTRGPQFEYSHRLNFNQYMVCCQLLKRRKQGKTRPGLAI